MKILYITNSRIPSEKGYGIQIFKMCEALADKKCQLSLILPKRKNRPFKNVDPFKYYQVKENFKITKLKSFDPVFLMKLPSGIYIKFQSLHFIISLFFYLIFKKNKKDFIFYIRDEYLLPVLQKFSKKVVWEAHSIPSNKKHYLKYWRKCFKIITITQELKNELAKLGVDKNKILVASDAVSLNEFINIKLTKIELKKKLNLPIDKNIIMYIGHFYDWKGAQNLADASVFLKNELIVFVGGTKNDVENFKYKNKKYKNILILGHKPYQDMASYTKAADVLILSNSAKDPRSKWTSPIKLFQYMASHTPIVASNLPSIKEILNDNNAILVKPDNPNALATGIQKVLADRELADKISAQAFKDVQNYTWHKRADKIFKFIA